jgi:hypothetical protein
LSLAHHLTNVLADWVSEGLLYRVGPSATERIVAGSAVEIFFWEAFYFVAAAAGQRCWIIAPILAMIAYGLVFHVGFLNFYISTGLSLWMMAFLWRPRLPWCWPGILLAALALLAHAVPLVWALGACCCRRDNNGRTHHYSKGSTDLYCLCTEARGRTV